MYGNYLGLRGVICVFLCTGLAMGCNNSDTSSVNECDAGAEGCMCIEGACGKDLVCSTEGYCESKKEDENGDQGGESADNDDDEVKDEDNEDVEESGAEDDEVNRDGDDQESEENADESEDDSDDESDEGNDVESDDVESDDDVDSNEHESNDDDNIAEEGDESADEESDGEGEDEEGTDSSDEGTDEEDSDTGQNETDENPSDSETDTGETDDDSEGIDSDTDTGSGDVQATDTGENTSDDTGDTGNLNDSDVHVFLLIGQSNMAGMPEPEAQDSQAHSRVEVLAYDNCSNLNRTYNEWYPATPPLHGCWEGVGPGDSFGKAMAEALPDGTILLVPEAISGVDIDFFRKDVRSSRRDNFTIAPDNQGDSAYNRMVERARKAQERGVIRGIIFHQGEADTGDPAWVGKVQDMVEDLRADLGFGEEVPFLAGELLQTSAACCAHHNPLINDLPDAINNAHAISSSGLNGMPNDEAHFDLVAQREFGERYAAKMIEALGL